MTEVLPAWTKDTGRFDSVNARHIFPSDNAYDIPTLAPVVLPQLPTWLVGYRTRVRNTDDAARGGLHFFLDDFRFEVVFDQYARALSGLTHFGVVLTPDFSLYREWPLTVQLWNVYRNRWCGAYWQSHGLRVGADPQLEHQPQL